MVFVLDLDFLQMPALAAQMIDRQTRSDLLQPGPDRRAGAQAADETQHAQEGFLHDVLGHGGIGGDAPGQGVDGARMFAVKPRKRVVVAPPRALHQRRFGVAVERGGRGQ